MAGGIFTAFSTLVLVVLILYLAFVCTKFIGKNTRIRGNARYIKLIDQLPVGQDKSLAVVKVGSDYLLLGIASAQITVLRELDGEGIPENPPDELPGIKVPDFREIMKRLGKEGDRKK